MRERPIPFSGTMVRALLAGTKTQTRRALREQPPADVVDFCTFHNPKGDGLAHVAFDPAAKEYQDWFAVCPYGQVGDRLWVREATIKVEDHGWVGPVFVESDAGREALEWGYGESDDPDHIPPYAIKRRPGMFMRRAWSRILLEVTEVRVERLQAISETDAIAEGIERSGDANWRDYLDHPHNDFTSARRSYRSLWEQINGPGSWEANPWVWAVSFRRLHA